MSSDSQVYDKIVHVDASRAIKDIGYARSVTAQAPAFVVYNDAFLDLLGGSPQIKLVETRDYEFAHEAGVFSPLTNSVFFTSNYQSSDPVEIHSVDCSTLAITKVAWPEVHHGNGACQYQSKVLYCSQGSRSVPSSLVLVDPLTNASETLINNFYGREFSSINDVVVNHKTGDIWFTDPTYGFEQAFRPSPTMPVQLYRFSPAKHQVWMVADSFTQCNGLCFSEDYKRMYVTDTGAIQAHAGPGDGHQFSCNPRLPATIYVYDVIHGQRLQNRRVFAYCNNGVPDGIKCDQYGNVYSGCGDGVHVWDTEGTLIGKINVGGTTANFCFTDSGLWLFAEKKLFFCRFGTKGALVDIECSR
ncbi:calcium-dependent phosphotriesterase [Mollisia scopiformis]|uniref:Calcium-dependent phosphotriesterase n=1 Tax=Mollisia scopiformis TaxID=149040 RepID=A0A194WVT6_MOLSC|nr:calcium-dependent phosphotriesterase [Mollisia scopiformis]KUJ11789.1 calcium-dependent phosphotriesterase [Mollisia scopiformis]